MEDAMTKLLPHLLPRLLPVLITWVLAPLPLYILAVLAWVL